MWTAREEMLPAIRKVKELDRHHEVEVEAEAEVEATLEAALRRLGSVCWAILASLPEALPDFEAPDVRIGTYSCFTVSRPICAYPVHLTFLRCGFLSSDRWLSNCTHYY